jgi:uncharacterized membrane protein
VIGFLHPELLLLALPAAVLWWRWRGGERGTRVVRALVLALLVSASAAPYLRTGQAGRDLVLVVDRSRSMPAEAEATALEVIRAAEEARRGGDRLAIVSFGANAGIETTPAESARFEQWTRALDRDGSNLGEALETALALIPNDRNGSIALLSDGESNGREPVAVARTAFARGVRIDTLAVTRAVGADIAVERLELPDEVGAFEPFQWHAWVRADEAREVEYVLERDGVELGRGSTALARGANRLTFRDVLPAAGTASYRLRILGTADRTPENDAGLAAVRVRGQRAVLVVNQDGAEDTFSAALRAGGLPVEVVAPESPRLGRLALTGFRAVVLENVPAARLGGDAMRALREFVLERGGGLLMTGGKASFGMGGYHLSPLDDVLPVSMEMRQETRKLGVGLAIALDRSGSMAVDVAPGVTKMQLANLGTCAAIELLSPLDSVAVIAVDSAAHTVLELGPVDNIAALTGRVRTIESMGGGIFCYQALLAAGLQLEKATQVNRHVILFADAADAEEQEKCPELIARFREMGITLSVVALGTPSDVDAAFLRRTAEQGGGQCYFTTDANELPRLFAQDTMTIARATFLDEPVNCATLPDLFGLGELTRSAFPPLDGYNVVWLEPEAACGVVTDGEYKTPAFSFQQAGLGRAAAYAGEIGGQFGQPLVAWEGFSAFWVTVARWLAGQEEPEEFFARARRAGREARFQVELDPAAPLPPDTSTLEVRLTGADGTTEVLPLERIGEHLFEARTSLAREGVVLGNVALGDGRTLALPPLVLPYSPEFEVSADPERGANLLRQLARESGGEVAPLLDQLLRGERGATLWRVVSRECALLALLLLLVEIAFRRLQFWSSLASTTTVLRARLTVRRATAPPTEQAPATSRAAAKTPTAAPMQFPAAPASQPRSPSTLDEALRRARKSADRELGR